jgi:serine/threonine protein kinase/Tol biopolymer transport system component
MRFPCGSQFGPYEILDSIGAGGMGEVYRARDTRLDRVVAIKVLRAPMAERPEIRQRFEREARVVSALNHARICTLYDIGRQDDIDYLVMEYLNGETLAERLKKGALPQDQILRIAIEVADALDRAHCTGITHRDLKPGNIMLTKDGAKVLDFGLAKIAEGSRPALDVSRSSASTLTGPLTEAGSIVGTLNYMAPELLEGKSADARTDVFAFGCVLYEMAAGRKAFQGTSPASLIAAIMESDPAPPSTLQAVTPPALDPVIKTCLAKDPEDRWQSARDIRWQLHSIAGARPSIGSNSRPARWGKRELIAWLFAGALMAAVVAFGIRASVRLSQESSSIEFTILPPADSVDFAVGPLVAVSPDGRHVAMRGTGLDGQTYIWWRPLASSSTRLLMGTAGATHMFWSSDSRFIGFFSAGRLGKIGIGGGPAAFVSNVFPDAIDGTWNRNGDIIFARVANDCLYRVSDQGGEAEPFSKLKSPHDEGHAAAHFLPDGRRFLYSVRSANQSDAGVYLASLQQREGRLLIRGGFNGYYTSPPGSSHRYIVFQRHLTLMAQAFDPDREEMAGEPFAVATGVLSYPRAFSTSENGVLAYRTGQAKGLLAWVDRRGQHIETVSAPGDYRQISLSPDEATLAVTRVDGVSEGGTLSNIWLVGLSRRTFTRLTSTTAHDWNPVWSPDGTRIAFSSTRNRRMDLFQRSASGSGSDEPLLESAADKAASSWSSDPRFLAYSMADAKTGNDIWILSLADRRPFVFLRTDFNEFHPTFSADGRWIAYTSDESGRPEVYVRRFEGTAATGREWPVSTNGGSHPRWRRDGKELFFLSADRKLMAVAIRTTPDFAVDNPGVMFQTRLPLTEYLRSYEVAANGQRFLLNTPVDERWSGSITVIAGWNP